MGRLSYGRAARLAVAGAVTAAVTAACSSGVISTSTTTAALSGPSGTPIKVGISLPLTGDFAADGQASEKGYQLWASDVNASGGLLGRPVRLVIRNDNSDEQTVLKDYTTLITKDRVDLTLAPFSSLLTLDAASITDKYGYVLAAGSAGSPKVYLLRSHNLFSTNVPAADQMVPFAQWVLKLTGANRPLTAAYPEVSDPFADPPVDTIQPMLEAGGIKTVYKQVYTKTSTAALTADAQAVANQHPELVVLGSVDVPTVSAFITEFAKMNFNPKIFIAAAGPDQGQAFLNTVGINSTGIMVPNGWYGSFPNALSHVMVQNYIAKYGGTASDINADVAEAYSAGEVIAAGVSGTDSLNQARIAAWLHSHALQTVLGPVTFDQFGKNLDALKTALIFQWQPGGKFVQVLPATATGSVPIIPRKPVWGAG